MIYYLLFSLFNVYVTILKFTYFDDYFTYFMFMLEYFMFIYFFFLTVFVRIHEFFLMICCLFYLENVLI